MAGNIDLTRIERSNFYFGKTLGEGSYARVVHAKLKIENAPEFAVKIMEKAHIQREDKVSYVMMEKQILSTINHPFIIKLYCTFHDEDYLYMCMDLAGGGELAKYIINQKSKRTSEGIQDTACSVKITQFYIAELILALEYLHINDIIHMDLKPENILFMKSGHIKLADFGTALRGLSEEALKNVFVGTAEYVSPEVLNEDFAISKSCDLWALGCIVFQMLTGRSPFRADTEYLVFQAINNYLDGTAPLEYPSTISENAKSLIESLLRKEPPSRLGAGVAGSGNSYADLKSHPFFDGIVWNDINRATPPYIPDPSNLPDPNEMSDGAFDDWMMEGEATPIDPYDLLPYASTPSMSAGPSKWDALLMPDETVVYSGAVWKRKGLFSKKRTLILTTLPRLLYADPDAKKLKGEIPWLPEKPVIFKSLSGNGFDIISSQSGRSYHFQDAENKKEKWQELLADGTKRLSIL